MQNPFLVGEHVYLRPLETADAPAMTPWMNDAAVTRTLQAHRPVNQDGERAFIERVTHSDTEVATAIVTRRGDHFIGTAALMKIQWRERQACFGISIGDKRHWGRGYGTEATRLLTAYAFETLNLNRVWLHVYDNNPAGLRAYEKAGYCREGVLRQAAFVEGAYRDVLAMAILREDWPARRMAVGKRARVRRRATP